MAGPAEFADFFADHMSITGMLISFVLSLLLTGVAARKLLANGFAVRDMYKRELPLVSNLVVITYHP